MTYSEVPAAAEAAPLKQRIARAPVSAVGVCERNPLCVRGAKHGGKGGHCSFDMSSPSRKHGATPPSIRMRRTISVPLCHVLHFRPGSVT